MISLAGPCRWGAISGGLVLLALAAGCRHVSTMSVQRPEGAARSASTTATAATTSLPSPLDLAAAKAIALRDNPDLVVAAARIDAAAAQVRQAASLLYPNAQLSFSASHVQQQPDDLTNGFGGEPFQRYAPALSASWLLYDGDARRLRLLAARYDVAGAQAAHREGQRLLLGAVGRAWYSAQLALQQRAIADADAAFSDLLYNDTEKRRVAGVASRADVLNFDVSRQRAAIASLAADGNYRQAMTVLAELLAVPALQLAGQVTLAKLGPLATEKPEFPSLMATAERRRPDLSQTAARRRQALAGYHAARGDRWPAISITGRSGAVSQDDLTFDSNDLDTSVALTATLDLDAGGAKAAAVAAARQQIAVIDAEYQRQLNAIAGELRSALETIQTLQAQARIQARLASQTLVIRDDVERQYRDGVAPLTRLNEVQRDYNVALLNAAVFDIQLRLTYEALALATGEVLTPYPAETTGP